MPHSNRVHNFSAGPATLPLEVLEKAREELTDYRGKGASIMEMSHRSPEYSAIQEEATNRLKSLVGAGEGWNVLFLGGGASTQFLMAPYNFLNGSRTVDYINTGAWSTKAIKEAKPFGTVNVSYTGEEGGFIHIPERDELNLSKDATYLHFTSNNTIFGTQFQKEPDSNGAPLVCDASSDFLSRTIDIDRYGLIYAGAQKNLGPSGVTVVLVHDSLLSKTREESIPTILRYRTHVEKLFHTPPVYGVYLVNYVLEWLEGKGGLKSMETLNQKKADLLYGEIDSDDFYRGTAEVSSRSLMNVTFRLQSEELEAAFLREAAKEDLVALKGHRSVGGIRASIYNACRLESVEALTNFMQRFRRSNTK